MIIGSTNTTNNQLEPPERFLRKHTGGGGGGQTRAKSARTYSGFSSFDHPYLHHFGVENLRQRKEEIIVFSSFRLMHEPSFASKNAVIYEKTFDHQNYKTQTVSYSRG